MTTEEYVKQALDNKHASALKRNQFNPSDYISGVENKIKKDFGSNFTTKFGLNPDLDTSSGLYQLAHQSGLGEQADRIIRDNSGEDLNKIFTGGFISDMFDALNMFSYGTVGLLKGKTFEDGIKSRESFSDKDSLGQYGLTGVIAGLVADIATDPLTYIAPWTVLKKIPGVTQVGKTIKEAVIGREVTKIGIGAEESYTSLEGGVMNGRAREMMQKVAYMFGADPKFKEAHDRMIAMSAAGTTKAMTFVKNLSKIDPKSAESLFTLRMDERLGRDVLERTNLDDLRKTLSSEDFARVEPIWNEIDALGKKMVDVGLLGKEKYEENLGKYIKNVYKEYELAKDKGFSGFKKTKIVGQKSRKEGEIKATRIEDPAYVLGSTMVHMINDIHTAEFFKKVSKFASDVEQDGFVKVPDTRAYITSQGAQAEAKKHISDINIKLTPLLKQLKDTHKSDKAVLSEIKKLEKDIARMSSSRSDELFKFFNEGATVKVVSKTARKLGIIPERLSVIANSIKKFDTFEDMINSSAGINLQKMWHDGVLQRNGFDGGEKAMRDFFDAAKHPFKEGVVKEKEVVLSGNIPKIIELQKRVEKLTDQVSSLKDIDKKSINNSFINLERQINELRLDKDDLVETIHNNKLSDLAGKYIPKEMFDYIDEIVNPTEAFGNRIIAEFKFMKVVLNPGTHVRNILSNRILNWWKLGIGPWRADLDAKTISELKNHGKYWDDWVSVGGGGDTYAASELKSILEQPETAYLPGKLGKWWTHSRKNMGDLYQWEESYAKMSAFIAMRDKGHSVVDSYKMSQSATFNYAQVTPLIRKMRTALWGMPFITFAVKSTPVAVETIAKHPGRVSVFGKIKNDIANASDIQETQQEVESEPPWVKEGFYFKLPYKDEHGRSMYFDLTYIIPFGDIVSGTLFSRPVNRETGTKEALPVSLASTNPVFNLLKELTRNESFTGERIFRESDPTDAVTADIMMHITKTFAPPWVAAQISPGYDQATGEKKSAGVLAATGVDSSSQKRDVSQELFGYLGMKVQPMNAELNESFQEWNKKKGLQTLLLENNIIENFERNYIPK